MIFYHEAPLCLFEDVQKITGGDYALVHLLEDDSYRQRFEEALAKGRDVILDNSLYELGTAFQADYFADWVRRLKPTWYIVPDVWHKGPETTRKFFDFINNFPDLPGKRIGVAQGESIDEVAECYKAIEPYCDMIAFNFDASWMLSSPQEVDSLFLRTRMSAGRRELITALLKKGVINKSKPHHLLGTGVPQEAYWYKFDTFIRSMDTCVPVMEGLVGESFGCDPFYINAVRHNKNRMCDVYADEFEPKKCLPVIKNNIMQMKRWGMQKCLVEEGDYCEKVC